MVKQHETGEMVEKSYTISKVFNSRMIIIVVVIIKVVTGINRGEKKYVRGLFTRKRVLVLTCV